ncbi:MAG: helix-turn-helix domain-containing protein, partial [Oscillospiraceae bacterium]|nr:helix-turn-helix domain-containing protein [Oscillospiraceae bacterium]
MEIGKRIQRLRREKDLTQEQMAAALGVTSAAVSKWETGAAIPDVSMLCPLARMLGTT